MPRRTERVRTHRDLTRGERARPGWHARRSRGRRRRLLVLAHVCAQAFDPDAAVHQEGCDQHGQSEEFTVTVDPGRKTVTVTDCCRARGTDRNWTRVDRKMSWSPAASSSQQRARVLTDVKARRFAPSPLRGADGLDASSAHARPDWLLPTMLTHTPPTCCGRRPVQNDALSGDR